MFDRLRSRIVRFRHGAIRRAPNSPTTVGVAQDTLPRYDVSDYLADFDLDRLGIMLTTPAWMTRAERLLLFTLTFCLRPERYLEIGTFQGGSALLVAAALDALASPGRLVCVDPEPQISPENWEKLQARTTLLTGRSPEILTMALEAAGGVFDLVLIDGDHTYQGTLRDAEGVLPHVASGGYVLFHDGFAPEVKRAIDHFVVTHAEQVADFGLLTREITVQIDGSGRRAEWGGLRMIYLVGKAEA